MIENHRPTNAEPGAGRAALWSAAPPLLCAVHCLATPILLAFAPVLTPSSRVEHAIMAGALLLAAGLLAWGIRVHGRLQVLIPAALGALVWVGGELTGSHSVAVVALHAAGGLLLAGGLAWSAWLRHATLCRECGCPAHEEAEEPAGLGIPARESAA